MYVCVCIYIYTHTYSRLFHLCVYIYIYMCIYVCVHIYIYIYIYIQCPYRLGDSYASPYHTKRAYPHPSFGRMEEGAPVIESDCRY